MSSTTFEPTPPSRGEHGGHGRQHGKQHGRQPGRRQPQHRPGPQLPPGAELGIHQVPHSPVHADPAGLHRPGGCGLRCPLRLGHGTVRRGRRHRPGSGRRLRRPGRGPRRRRPHLRHRVRPADPGLARGAADELRVHHGHGPLHLRGRPQADSGVRRQVACGHGDGVRPHRGLRVPGRPRVPADPGQLQPQPGPLQLAVGEDAARQQPLRRRRRRHRHGPGLRSSATPPAAS